jgi:hypothetical protein
VDPGDGLGRQVVQRAIVCKTTNTTGDADENGDLRQKDTQPFNSYSVRPNNVVGSVPNLVHGSFITSPTGPQTGGGNTPGSRAAIVGGVSVKPKGSITHRGWANPTINSYPRARVPPRGAPAQLKINDPNHYKI